MSEIVYVCRNPRCMVNHVPTTFSLDEADVFHSDEGDDILCPDCGSNDIEEGRRCKICGDIHLECDLEDGACKSCHDHACQCLSDALNGLQPWVKELLEDKYGNLNITEL